MLNKNKIQQLTTRKSLWRGTSWSEFNECSSHPLLSIQMVLQWIHLSAFSGKSSTLPHKRCPSCHLLLLSTQLFINRIQFEPQGIHQALVGPVRYPVIDIRSYYIFSQSWKIQCFSEETFSYVPVSIFYRYFKGTLNAFCATMVYHVCKYTVTLWSEYCLSISIEM